MINTDDGSSVEMQVEPGNSVRMDNALSEATSDNRSQFTDDLASSIGNFPERINMNMLVLSKGDFPDVCTHCEECMRTLKEAIHTHAYKQIKDADIGEAFKEQATAELFKFLNARECGDADTVASRDSTPVPHKHHIHTEHNKLEADLTGQFANTRRAMLNNQREKRKFKFNQPEYKISRRVMVDKVSKLIHMRVSDFMKALLSHGPKCRNKNE